MRREREGERERETVRKKRMDTDVIATKLNGFQRTRKAHEEASLSARPLLYFNRFAVDLSLAQNAVLVEPPVDQFVVPPRTDELPPVRVEFQKTPLPDRLGRDSPANLTPSIRVCLMKPFGRASRCSPLNECSSMYE